MRNLLTQLVDRTHGNARLGDLPLGWVRPSEENDHLSCQAAPSLGEEAGRCVMLFLFWFLLVFAGSCLFLLVPALYGWTI
jgi:hypothetical protein